MVDSEILDLYSDRRELLFKLTNEIKDHTDLENLDSVPMDTYSIITKMTAITDAITNKCNGDYILMDLYRRLSLCLSKEEYEQAALLKNEICLYKI